MHYYAIIIILVENGLKTAILSLIAIISGTIYRPAKFVIVTGLRKTRGDFARKEVAEIIKPDGTSLFLRPVNEIVRLLLPEAQ